jgi:desulfoferrodoxin (superoxide reductase-like protein)
MLIAVLQTAPAFANVPTVTSVVAWTRQSDNHTILNITVVHTGYFSGHYVDWVKVNISGTVQTMNLTDSSPVDQTSSSTFVVPYDMGVLSDTPTTQAQANCIVHGPSPWSPTLTIPEFSSLQLVLALVILTIATLLFKSRSSRKVSERFRFTPFSKST